MLTRDIELGQLHKIEMETIQQQQRTKEYAREPLMKTENIGPQREKNRLTHAQTHQNTFLLQIFFVFVHCFRLDLNLPHSHLSSNIIYGPSDESIGVAIADEISIFASLSNLPL